MASLASGQCSHSAFRPHNFTHCTFRSSSSHCSDQSTQISHLQRIANILKQSAPHIGNHTHILTCLSREVEPQQISWWARKTFNCIFSLTPLWAEKYLAENSGPTAAPARCCGDGARVRNFYQQHFISNNYLEKKTNSNSITSKLCYQQEFKQVGKTKIHTTRCYHKHIT